MKTDTSYDANQSAGFASRLFFWLGIFIFVPAILLFSSIPLSVNQQLFLALALLVLSIIIRPGNERARYRIHILIVISVLASGRYIYWRLTESLGWNDPTLELSFFDYFFSFGLLAAEIYAWITLFLGYFQTLWPLDRRVVLLPEDQRQWPTVDVFIPTYDEALSVVMPTVAACRELDWPTEKLNVFLLDDGNRSEFEAFANKMGVRYISRTNNVHAKAGNINNALSYASGEFLAVFDCDHIPVRSFLTKTMGWFLRDRKLGILQTPHFFYSPDPVERNLGTFNTVPSEGSLFYKLIQRGMDTWNASFFCGSSAILRREALDEAGGIATETVTEDAHTSLRIQKEGWNTAYIDLPLAAGLATDRISAHIGQRSRWARGMIQIFRLENPLFARGLSLAQRLSYFNAAAFFFFSLPRVIFLTAPLAYLFLNAYIIQASAAMIAVYALPHILQAHIANSAMQSSSRHSFWSEVYEAILAGKLIPITFSTLFRPGAAKFNVTKKGDTVEKEGFEWGSSRFVFFLLILNVAGLIVGLVRMTMPELSDRGDVGTLIINIAWTLYNSIILGAAFVAGWEKRQRRKFFRLPRQFKAQVMTVDGITEPTTTRELSFSNATIDRLPKQLLAKGDQITLMLEDEAERRRAAVPAVVSSVRSNTVGLTLNELSSENLRDLTHFAYSRTSSWEPLDGNCKPKKVLASFFEILRFGLRGIWSAMFGMRRSNAPVEAQVAVRGWVLFGVITAAGLLMSSTVMAAEATQDPVMQINTSEPVSLAALETPERSEEIQESFASLGYQNQISLAGGNLEKDVWFSIPADRTVTAGQLKLHYSIPEFLPNKNYQVNVALNGKLIGDFPLDAAQRGRTLEAIIDMPSIFFTEKNQITFNLTDVDDQVCAVLTRESQMPVILPTSEINTQRFALMMENDLAHFPVPFMNLDSHEKQSLPMVFTPTLATSPDAIKAAGILASWLGAKADYRRASFPIHMETPPAEHSIVFATAGSRPALLADAYISGPGVIMLDHPRDKTIKLLAIVGRTPEELVNAASALASESIPLSGTRISFSQDMIPAKKAAYDVPRWLNAGQKTRFSALTNPESLIWSVQNPSVADLEFRLPPDLHRSGDESVPVNITYQYRGAPQSANNKLTVGLNDEWDKSFDTENYSGGSAKKFFTADYPLYKMAGKNKLSFFQKLDFPNQSDAISCVALENYQSEVTISPNSTIDLTEFTHFARMPDLSKFANMGFPFTRFADLSETAVLMPLNPSAAEISLLMDIFAHIGNSTGYPVYHVSITSADKVEQYKDHDLLVIGNKDNQPLLTTWSKHIQLAKNGSQWTQKKREFLDQLSAFWNTEKIADSREVQAALESSDSLATLISFQSPLKKQRTVVAMGAEQTSDVGLIAATLGSNDLISQIQGDTVLMSEEGVKSYRIASTYQVGEISNFKFVQWYLKTKLVAFILISILGIFLAAAWLYLSARQVAARRLPQTQN